jgi:hypothetical protein
MTKLNNEYEVMNQVPFPKLHVSRNTTHFSRARNLMTMVAIVLNFLSGVDGKEREYLALKMQHV